MNANLPGVTRGRLRGESEDDAKRYPRHAHRPDKWVSDLMGGGQDLSKEDPLETANPSYSRVEQLNP